MAKARDVARLFIDIAAKQWENEQGDAMTNLRLQKLLYFAQGWFMARYERPLFEEPIEAWKYGPVVPEIYAEYQRFGGSAIFDVPPDDDAFAPDEFAVLMDVVREYWKYSSAELVKMSHAAGTPWDDVYRDGMRHIPLQNETIKAFFKSQERLKSFNELISENVTRMEVIRAKRGGHGEAVLPKEIDEDWGDWDE